MSERNITTTDEGDGGVANIVYILYLVGIAVGITTIVGLVMAYVNDGNAPSWLRTHYRYQIRTFWIGVLYGLLASLLSLIGIGLLMVPLLLIWWVVRCVKGMRALAGRSAIENPGSWLI